MIRPLLFTLALGALTASAQAQQSTALPDIYGSVVFGHGWEDMGDSAPYGIYSVPPTDGNAIKLVKAGKQYHAIGGGVYVDGRYYLVDYSTLQTEGAVYFRTYDVNDGWKLLREVSLSSLESIASDLTYDPTTDQIFGCFVDAATYSSESKTYFFGTLNALTGESTRIASLPEELICIAANREGELYGIGALGALYKVDKTSGSVTKIGESNRQIKYAQSATFDYTSGRMLWAMTPHYTDESPEICEVNLQTGQATTLTTIPERYELTGIYTLSPFTLDGAPSRPTNFACNYAEGALSGTIAFDVPTTTFAGSQLSGDLRYEVKLDGEMADEGTVKAGTQRFTLSADLERGMHEVKVAVTNATGRSPYAIKDFWAGTDVAQAVNPTATKVNDTDVAVQWTAPATGIHGGYIHTEGLSYTVTRMPDGVKIYEGTATSVTDKSVDQLSFDSYYYQVTARVDGTDGEAAYTQPMHLGKTLHLPYLQGFNSEMEAGTMTIENHNNDCSTWEYYDMGMVYGLSDDEVNADDWLITPAFNLSADSVYHVSIDASTDEGATETLGIFAGTAPKGDAMTQTILPHTAVTNVPYQSYGAYFRPATDGTCYVGVHAASTYADGSYLYADNLRVNLVSSVYAPAAPASVAALPQGTEQKVQLSFTAPSTDYAGNALSAISRIEVLRTTDGEKVATIANAEPGKVYTLTDEPYDEGTNTYTVTAYNDHGAGIPVTASAYVGLDTPAAVTDVKLSATDDGNVSLSWKAPATGLHGGNIDAAALTYRIGNLNGTESATTIVSETAYSEQVTLTEGTQRLMWYTIQPRNSKGQGRKLQTDTIFVGAPYAMPYSESFKLRSLERGPWNTLNSDLAEWNLLQYGSYTDAADNDNGLIAFSTLSEGSEAKLVSPKISLVGGTQPRLTFYLWNMKQAVHSLRVQLRGSGGRIYTLALITPNETDNETLDGEWKRYEIDLTPYVRLNKYVQLIFTGIGGHITDYTVIPPVYLDRIGIDDPTPQNLAAQLLKAKKDHVEVGDDVDFTLTVNNKGTREADNYRVRLYRDSLCVDSVAGPAVTAEGYATVQLHDVPNADAAETSRYTATIVWDDDADLTDNTSPTCVVTVLPGRPFVSSVQATKDNGNVTLSWEEPQGIAAGTEAATVTEDFESYAAFTISHFGEWALHDGDRQTTLGIQDGKGYFVQYDNVESPMAFQIFNPSAVNLSSYYFPTHSGKQVAAAFNAGRYTANDDWLISPEVDGAQTITFWACSPDASYYDTNEQMEVLYSTTDTLVTSFTKIGNTYTVPQAWTQYSVTLPEGTRHFAIRCTSLDQYILFVDDITYRKAARDFRLLGYNVYRNGTLLTPAPIATTSYTDAASSEGDYRVSAVYNTGESRQTAAQWVSPSDIGTIETDSSAPAAVYDTQGRLLPSTSLPAAHGVYIVRKGGKTVKVMR